ncbi:MAG: AAA domain-containing protein [Eubacteriales bacterium]
MGKLNFEQVGFPETLRIKQDITLSSYDQKILEESMEGSTFVQIVTAELLLRQNQIYLLWKQPLNQSLTEQIVQAHYPKVVEEKLITRLKSGNAIYANFKKNQTTTVEGKKCYETNCYFFTRQANPVGEWNITVDPKQLTKSYGNAVNLATLCNDFQLDLTPETFAYSLKAYVTQEEKQQNLQRGSAPTFRIYGTVCDLLLRLSPHDQVLEVVDVVEEGRDKRKVRAENPIITPGKLTFTSERIPAPPSVQEILKDHEGSNYVKLWDKYAQQEGEEILQKIRGVGLIELGDFIQYITQGETTQYQFHLKTNINRWKIDPNDDAYHETKGTLLFTPSVPAHLAPEVSWTHYLSLQVSREERRSTDTCQYKLDIENHTITLSNIKANILEYVNRQSMSQEQKMLASEGNDKEEDIKYITLHLPGEITNIKRRTRARNRMQDGGAAHPYMHEIIQGRLHPQPDQDTIKEKVVLSKSVKDQIFGNYGCSDVQKQAIEIALNSPDIVVIQGPPGTGKTTVITAIIHALNEKISRDQRKAGDILITSYQNDAVGNLTSRLRVNSLPPVLFQSQFKLEEQTNQSGQFDPIEQWWSEWSTAFQEKHPRVNHFRAQKELTRLYQQYESYPTRDAALTFLAKAQGFQITEETKQMIATCKSEFEWQSEARTRRALSACRKLRYTVKGFCDDGPDRIREAIAAIVADHPAKEKLTQSLKERYPALFQAGELTLPLTSEEQASLPQHIEKLRIVREELLDQFTPRHEHQKGAVNQEMQALYEALKSDLDHFDLDSGKPTETEVLAKLLSDISNNKSAITEAMSKYSLVYASSIQQSMGKAIIEKKKMEKNTDSLIFETVIVDEAARANPMDLMISLTQASRRIILVGDHRQLPHTYDQALLHKIQPNPAFDAEKSMFQELMECANMLEGMDGIKRTIQLDVQYRMHPVLAKFVSEQFYEKHGTGEGFSSPDLTQTQIEQQFGQPFEEGALLWLDVQEGEVTRKNNSLLRRSESESIAEKLMTYFKQIVAETEEEKKRKYAAFTFGIITFYSGQKLEIEHQLELEKDKLKQGYTTQEYEQLSHLIQGVRVGTVDSFQGMEFDVMFLSLVRTGKNPPIFEEKWQDPQYLESAEAKAELELLGRRTYGFLDKENRLCVALSRQKRLLVVAGDRRYYGGAKYWNWLASKIVPSLCALAEQHRTIKEASKTWM